MNKLILSIIIPVYNAEKDIISLIDNLEQFIYKNIIEIICIDDGSTDKSLSRLNGLSYDNVKVYSQSNKGVSSARNLGLGYATGKYILFIDADDEIFIKDFDKLMNQVIKNESDLTMFGLRDIFFHKNGRVVVFDNYTENRQYKRDTFYENFGKLLNKDIMYSPCNKIYKRSIIEKNNLRFNEDYAIGEDMLFNLSYLSYVDSVEMSNLYVYGYHHDLNQSESGSKKYHENEFIILLEILKRIESLLNKQNEIERNEIELHKFTIRKISYSINNLFFKGSNLSDEEKLKFITNLYKVQIIMDALEDKHIRMDERDQKILLFLHRKKRVRAILYLYKLRNRWK